MVPLTGQVVRSEVLDRTMEALAHNDAARDALMGREGPDLHGLLELIEEAQRIVTYGGRVVERMLEKANEITKANLAEYEALAPVASWADRTATDLRRAEQSPGVQGEFTGRRVARDLIALLDTISPETAMPHFNDAVEARVEIHELFRRVPADMLFRKAVTYHLGAKRTRALAAMHKTWAARRHSARPSLVPEGTGAA